MPEATAALGWRGRLRDPDVLNVLGAVTFVLAWQVIAMVAGRIFLASPLDVVLAIPSVLSEGGLLSAYVQTMSLFLASFAVSVVTGLGIGLLTGLNRPVRLFAEPLLIILYATPSLVLIPLFVLWFGIGSLPKVALVFLSTFFPIVINTQLGISELGPEMRELGRAFGASPRELITKIVIPSIIPHVLTAVRVTTPRSFVALLAGEMLISVGGLGSLVVSFSRAFRTDAYFLTVVVVVLTSIALSYGVRRLEAAIMPWRRA